MYKFKGKGNEAVWDEEDKKVLCRFKSGFFETEDRSVREKLAYKGYEEISEPKEEVIEEVVAETVTTQDETVTTPKAKKANAK